MESARNIFFIFIQTLCLSEAARKPNILFIVADDLGEYSSYSLLSDPEVIMTTFSMLNSASDLYNLI